MPRFVNKAMILEARKITDATAIPEIVKWIDDKGDDRIAFCDRIAFHCIGDEWNAPALLLRYPDHDLREHIMIYGQIGDWVIRGSDGDLGKEYPRVITAEVFERDYVAIEG